MKTVVMLATFSLATVCGAPAQNVVGDWQGTLKANGAEVRVVLHVTKAENGSLKATMDSPDQMALGIPVTSIESRDSKLSFTVDSITPHGSYEGKVNADGTEISGAWTQGDSLPLDLKRTAAPSKTEHKPAKPSDIDGAWSGALETPGGTLHLVFHITNTEDGLTATMDSIEQSAKGIPVTGVTRDGSSLKMEMKQIAGAFEGKISKDLTSIDGSWTQGGASLPLLLKRAKD
ncbi:MAG: hypothetical protein ABSB82_10515 [Terriglobia bacterium]